MLTFPCAVLFFFSSRRRHTRSLCDWSSDVCSSDLTSTSDGELEISVLSLIRPFRSTSTPLFITHGAFLQDIGKVNMLLPARSRSEERRVGKECRSSWSWARQKKNTYYNSISMILIS